MRRKKTLIPQKTINDYVRECHENALAKGFWDYCLMVRCKDFPPEFRELAFNQAITTFIMLISTELSEAVEALRKNDQSNFREELADVAIRLFDLAGGLGIDLQSEIDNKMKINSSRGKRHGKLF
jgi:NTP pyrophosphatase (non-canonical NTP hydrolase)